MIPVLADPSGPPDTRPPNKPPPPPPPSKGLAADLDHAELLLRLVQLLTADRFAGLDPALLHQLKTGLRTARIAIDGAKTPARPHLSSAAAVAGGPVKPVDLTQSAEQHLEAAAASGPGRLDRAGGPPAPGADFDLPEPRPWPGRPFPVYEVSS